MTKASIKSQILVWFRKCHCIDKKLRVWCELWYDGNISTYNTMLIAILFTNLMKLKRMISIPNKTVRGLISHVETLTHCGQRLTTFKFSVIFLTLKHCSSARLWNCDASCASNELLPMATNNIHIKSYDGLIVYTFSFHRSLGKI